MPEQPGICKQIIPVSVFEIASGDAADVVERLDKGLLDFGVLLDPVDIAKYNYLRFPVKDVWGVLMRKDSPLAVKDSIHPQDLWDKPLSFPAKMS